MRILTLILLQLLFLSYAYSATPQISKIEKTINLEDDIEFSYYHFISKTNTPETNTVALWVLSGYPNHKRLFNFANELSKNNIEVWAVDFLDNLFMPKGVNSIRQLSGKYVSQMIKRIHQKTGKNVILIAESYSAIPVLRGAYEWQLSKPKKRYLSGAVLFSPNLFEAIPNLGEKPKFVAIASSTSIPILLYQSQKSNTRGQLQDLLSTLQKSNATVYTSMLKNAIAIFYHEDKTPETLRYLKTLPKNIANRIKLLEASPLPLKTNSNTIIIKTTSTPLDSGLKPYKAKNSPHNLNLKDVFGHNFVKTDYKNQITIINFWATWCKPCLEEIPSLNRLKAIMKDKPFEIISINYGEKPEKIKQFMKKVKIDFPILIDEPGEQAVKWNVFAFPSTFVIGPNGKFHYGVNAGIIWDTPEIIKTLNNLY